MAIDTYLPIIILNVNGLNVLIKKTEWWTGLERKTQLYNMLPRRDFYLKDTDRN